MATTIRELFVKLGIKADTKAVAEYDSGINQVASGMADLGRIALIAATAVAAVTAAMIAGVVTTAAYGDEIGKSAKQLGISTEELQKWRFAAAKAGISQEQLQIGLLTLTRALEAASRGSGEAINAFKEFGIEVENEDGTLKSQTQILRELSEVYNDMEDPVKRAALLTQIFGESGAALGPLLAEGAEGIEELMQRAEDLGLIMSEEAVQASEEFTNSMTDLTAILTGLRNKISIFLMPTLTRMINTFTEWYIANREIIDQKLEEWADRIGKALESIPKKAAAILEFFGGIKNVITLLTTAGAALVGGFFSIKVIGPIVTILSGLLTILGAIATVLGVPLAFAAAIVAGGIVWLSFVFALLAEGAFSLFLILQDLYTFISGGDSVLGALLEKIGLNQQAFETFWAVMSVGKDLFMSLFNLAFALGELYLSLLIPAIKLVGVALSPVFDLFVAFISFVGGAAMDAIMILVGALEQAVKLINFVTGGVAGLSGVSGPDFNAGAGLGNETISNSNQTNNSSVNQNNTINVSGAGDPAAVGGNVADEIGNMFNTAAASFAGGAV